MTEAKSKKTVTQHGSKNLPLHCLYGTKTKSFVFLTDRENQRTAKRISTGHLLFFIAVLLRQCLYVISQKAAGLNYNYIKIINCLVGALLFGGDFF